MTVTLAGMGACIAVALGAVPTLGQTQPLDLEESMTDANVKGATTKVGLANNTDQPQTVSLAVRVPGARLADGTPAEPASVLLVAPLVPLGPRQRADVELVPNPAVALAPGSYRGVVEATSEVAGARDERGVVVTVATAGAKATALPGLDKWTVVLYRTRAPGEQDRGAHLPLKKPSPGVTVPNPLGHLSDGSGRSLTVTGAVSADGKKVALDFPDHAYPGTYEGTIDFTPEDKETGALVLTVRRTDSVVLATAAIALSLLGSYLGQRHIGVKRQLAQLIKQANAAVETIKAGDRAFSAAPEVRGFALVASARETLQELRSAVKKLRRRFVLSIDAASLEYKAADALRLSLEEAARLWNADRIEAWRKLKHDLGDLHLEARPPGALKQSPQWVLTAQGLLVGSPLELKGFAARVAKLEATAELVKRWDDLHILLTGLRQRLTALEAQATMMPESDRLELERAVRLVAGISWDAWHAEDPADFAARAAEAELDQAEAVIGQLSGWLRVPSAADTPDPVSDRIDLIVNQCRAVEVAGRREGFVPLPFPVGGLDRVVGWAGEVVKGVAAGAGRLAGPVFDRTIVVLAVVAALWAGLVQLYFDKPFGSLRDYIAALTWGIATKTALDGVASVVAKLRSPLPDTPDTPTKAVAASTAATTQTVAG